MISTRQAAKRLGLSAQTLCQYIVLKKIPAPQVVMLGRMRVHSWTEAEIEHVRQILPEIANGRATRFQRERAAREQAAKEKELKKKGKKATKNKRP